MDNLHMDAKQQAFEEKMNKMQSQFIDGLADRFVEIDAAWENAQTIDGLEEGLATLHELIHKLTGTAGTFYLTEISMHARALEILLKTLIESAQPFNYEAISQINALLAEVKQAPTLPSKAPATHLKDLKLKEKRQAGEKARVLVIDDDTGVANSLSIQLKYFGFDVEAINSLSELDQLVKSFHPDVIIADINFPEGELAGIDAMHQLTQTNKVDIPFIFLTSHTDITARLQAVRAQGKAFFTKPVNISKLLDKITELTSMEEETPFHVLVVDDDKALVELMTYLLNKSGMKAKGISNPLSILDEMDFERPDLILLDLHMPECTGIEIAQVIRQHDRYAHIPIVFVSAEDSRDLQFEAVLRGGDDFLMKPVKAEELIPFVHSRAHRARIMGSQLIRDGLTNLYNHTYIKESINREMEHYNRDHSTFSIGMIDVDHFKEVNDRYGHMVGDQVLKNLANFLTSRLRKTDLIGRYGGEEFIVLFPNTDKLTAMKIMQEILENFSKVVHTTEAQDEFFVTFSGGIIDCSCEHKENLKGSALVNLADQALYEAKANGRNRIELAEC